MICAHCREPFEPRRKKNSRYCMKTKCQQARRAVYYHDRYLTATGGGHRDHQPVRGIVPYESECPSCNAKVVKYGLNSKKAWQRCEHCRVIIAGVCTEFMIAGA